MFGDQNRSPNQTSPLTIFTLSSCSPQSCFNQHVGSLRLGDILITLCLTITETVEDVYTIMAVGHSDPVGLYPTLRQPALNAFEEVHLD